MSAANIDNIQLLVGRWLERCDYGEYLGRACLQCEIENLKAVVPRIKELEDALAEAMSVRHFCDMESQPETDDPYRYDAYLRRWAKALGRKVESNWPNPGDFVSVPCHG